MSKSPLPDNIPSVKNIAWGVAGEMSKKVTPKDLKGAAAPAAILLAIVAIFGVASSPFKILLRTNFGNKAITVHEIIFGAFFFVVFAFSFAMLSREVNIIDESSLKYTVETNPVYMNYSKGMFGLALLVLVKGFFEYFRAQRKESDFWLDENYRGDSLLFRKEAKTLKMQLRTWKKIEPSLCLIISMVLFFIIDLAAIPLIISSIAFRLNEHYHVTYKWEKLEVIEQSNVQSDDNNFGDNQYVNTD